MDDVCVHHLHCSIMQHQGTTKEGDTYNQMLAPFSVMFTYFLSNR